VTRTRCGEIEPTGLNLAQRLDNETAARARCDSCPWSSRLRPCLGWGPVGRAGSALRLPAPRCCRTTSGVPPRRPGARGRGGRSGAGMGRRSTSNGGAVLKDP